MNKDDVKTVTIRFPNIDSVLDFIRVTKQYKGELNLRHGHRCVDGKSLLGVYSMDLQREMFLDIIGEDEDVLIAQLGQFIV